MNALLQTAMITAAIVAVEAIVERFGIAAPRHRGPISDHFDGKRFFNSDPVWQSERSFVKWQLTRRPGAWREWVDAPFGPPPPERVGGGRLRVTFIGHATMLIQMDVLNILTDPIWSRRCSPVPFAGPGRHRPPGIRFEDLPPIDVVLVSHNHYDHLDVPTLKRLASAGGSQANQPASRRPSIVTPLGNGLLMKKHGIKGATELDWWETIRVSDDVVITLVPSMHFSARGLTDRNANLWGGFVISGPSGHAYFAGDSGWGPHFEEIGARFQPLRVAMLPIGAYLPRWFMKPAHITPAEAVDAHFALRARTSIAMHYGTFALGDDGEMEPLEDLRTALAAKGNPNFLILEHGEGREVP